MVKDILEKATEPKLDLKAYLQDAYVHPVFKDTEFDRPTAINDEENNPLIATKRKHSRKDSKGDDIRSIISNTVLEELSAYL